MTKNKIFILLKNKKKYQETNIKFKYLLEITYIF